MHSKRTQTSSNSWNLLKRNVRTPGILERRAKLKNLVSDGDLRQLTPSQVTSTFFGCNGANEAAIVYGRNRAQLYYAIWRWYESFR